MCPKVFLTALGCKLNANETELLSADLEANGFEITDDETISDYMILNSCTVTGKSDRRTRNYIRSMRRKNEKAVIIVTGCSAQLTSPELDLVKEVDFIRGNMEKESIPSLLLDLEAGGTPPRIIVSSITEPGPLVVPLLLEYKTKTRPFIKIQDGCNNGCTYCAIPLARGPQRSSLPEKVLQQVEIFAKQNFAEVVLSGVHLGGYGDDLEEDINLTKLLKKMLEIENCPLIRISSIEPLECTDELFELLEKEMNGGRICRHLHIPLQNGSDATLERMNRRYRRDLYKILVNRLVTAIPGISVGSDVLVGFPGSTNVHFEECRSFVEELPLSYLHVFAYSIRPGTLAATMKNQVSPDDKKERSRIIREISAEKRAAFLKSQIGKPLIGIVVQPVKTDTSAMEVLTDNYIKIICTNWPSHIETNSVITVKPVKIIEGNTMSGEIVTLPKSELH